MATISIRLNACGVRVMRPARLRFSSSSMRRAEPAAGPDQMIDVLEPVRAELGAVVLGEEVAEGLQGAQRFLKVVRDDVGEVLQLAVDRRSRSIGPLQLVAAGAEFVGEAVLLGQIEGGAARANEAALLVVHGHRAQPDIDERAVLLAPLRLAARRLADGMASAIVTQLIISRRSEHCGIIPIVQVVPLVAERDEATCR